MFRPGARPNGGPSKATAQTVCQKCLKKGHYSYECTITTVQRPYKSRPSRTQQLLNPKLAPQLTNDAPNDLERKKGVADEQLARIASERGAKRRKTGDNGYDSDTSASSSVATISTNQSRSVSPPPNRRSNRAREKKSPSFTSSEHFDSEHSDTSVKRGGRGKSHLSEQRRSRSPATREIRKSRSRSPHRTTDRSARRRDSSREGHKRQQKSRRPERTSSRQLEEDLQEEKRWPEGKRRLRSLSPYSKRLALTQAMNL